MFSFYLERKKIMNCHEQKKHVVSLRDCEVHTCAKIRLLITLVKAKIFDEFSGY